MKKFWLLAAALAVALPASVSTSEAACCRPMMGKKMMGAKMMAKKGMKPRRMARRARGPVFLSSIPATPPYYFRSQWSRVAGVYVPRPTEIFPAAAPPPRPFFFGLF